ncbi:MAG: dihydrofolate reductase [Bacteroidota bacterium]
MPIISIVVALAENNAIGKDNDLLWHLPNDLKRFKSITSGHPVVMGRKTYLSLPGGPLKNRENIILTTNKTLNYEGCTMANTVEQVLDITKGHAEVFILGGAKVYKEFLPHTDKLYLTRVHAIFEEADTFFPEFDDSAFKEIENIRYPSDEKHAYPYSFITLKRK